MKRNAVTTTIEEDKTIRYDEKAIGRVIEARQIRQQAVLDIFNMSNPTTAKNWMTGYTSPPINRVLHLCSMLDLEPLEFISYYGHKFKSRMADLYLLEMGGKTVGDILRELNIETISEPTVTKPVDQEYADRREEERIRLSSLAHAVLSSTECVSSSGNKNASALNSFEFIDRIISIQKEAQQHEADAIKEVRDEMQKKIDERDETIQSLQRQLANANAENQMLRKYMDQGSYSRTGIIQDPGHITSHKDVTDI